MSCTELIESLKKSADGKKILLWQEAQATATATRARAENELKRLRENAERQRAAAVRDRTARAIAEACSRARTLRLAAEKELAGRLYTAAVSSLKSLRNSDYEAVFHSLVRELPLIAWQTVRVNPQDAALAGRYFPGAKIMPDETIVGGMGDVGRRGSHTDHQYPGEETGTRVERFSARTDQRCVSGGFC